MLKQRHQLFAFLLLCVDGCVAAVACYVAWAIRMIASEQPWPQNTAEYIREPLVLLVVPVVLFAMWASRLYQAHRDRSIVPELGEILRASLLSLAGIIVLLWAAGNKTFGLTAQSLADPAVWLEANRLQVALLAALLPLLLGAHRTIFRLVLRHFRRPGHNLRHVIVIGTGRLGQIVCRTLERNSWTGLHVDSFISHHDVTKRTECLDRPVRGGISDIKGIVERVKPDAVYLAIPPAAGLSRQQRTA